MAVSPLAEFDFDNLPSVVPVEVIKALCIATQERFNIAACLKSGLFRTTGFDPDDQYKALFPYKSNTSHKWTLNENDPLGDFTADIEKLLSKCAGKYADIEKWDDADTDNETFSSSGYQKLLSYAADDSGTYDNRLFEITGYTSYPDLSVYAPEEVKKWYDMLEQFKYVYRVSGYSHDDYKIYDGEFDIESGDPYYSNDDDLGRGAEWYGRDATSSTDTLASNSTIYNDYKSGNDNLFGTFSSTYNESTDSGTYPPTSWEQDYSTVFRRLTSGDYRVYNRSFTVTYVSDLEDLIGALGIVGRPISYKHQTTRIYTQIKNNTTHDTNMSFPYSTTANNQRYYCDLTVTQDGYKDLIEVDAGIGLATLPASQTSIPTNSYIQSYSTINSSLTGVFLEFWDDEGGFEYYTS